MKQTNRQPRALLFGACLLAIFLGWLVRPEFLFAQSEKSTAKISQSGTFRVKVAEGQLSVQANQAPLAKVFEEIGKQARIVVESSIAPEETITIHFDRLPLEEGIRKLAKNVSLSYAQDSKEKAPRITRVVVLGGEKTQSLGRAPAPTQTSKAPEPAPKPEPFKFEFDPTKFAEKEKPVKSK
jgi:hypothetical protein